MNDQEHSDEMAAILAEVESILKSGRDAERSEEVRGRLAALMQHLTDEDLEETAWLLAVAFEALRLRRTEKGTPWLGAAEGGASMRWQVLLGQVVRLAPPGWLDVPERRQRLLHAVSDMMTIAFGQPGQRHERPPIEGERPGVRIELYEANE